MGDTVDLSGQSFPDLFGSFSAFDPAFMGANPIAQVGGSVSIPQAPEASSVVGDWTNTLDTFTNGLGKVASAVNSFSAAKVAQQNALADQNFAQFSKNAELDLARTQITGQQQIAQLSLAAELAKARAAITSGLPQSSIFYQLGTGQASMGQYVIVGGLILLGVWAYRKAKRA